MMDWNKAIEKMQLFIEWLERETEYYSTVDLEFKQNNKVLGRIYCQYYGFTKYMTLEDLLRLIDIFDGNIDLIFENKHLDTFEKYKEVIDASKKVNKYYIENGKLHKIIEDNEEYDCYDSADEAIQAHIEDLQQQKGDL